MKQSSSLTSTVALVTAFVLVLLLFLAGLSSAPDTLSGLLTIAILTATIAALWASRRERLRAESRLRAQSIEAALAKERLGIARELHDIVSHGLALVTMRASVARYATPLDAEALGEALSDIEETSRATTRDLRCMLQALRTDNSDAPAPMASELADLVQQARTAGIDITSLGLDTVIHSPAVSITIYRIVQEGLSNIARHAGPTSCLVELSRDSETVVIRVTDDGPRNPWHRNPGAGIGLLGLRERVSTINGTLETGRCDRGFFLSATLPDPEGFTL